MSKPSIKRDLPLSYYMKQTITSELVSAAVAQQYVYMCNKASKHIKTKLNKLITRNDTRDLINEVVVRMLERFDKGLLTFTTQSKVIGYILGGCWFNYINQNTTRKSKAKPTLEEEWMIEMYQHQPAPTNKNYTHISLDFAQEIACEEPRLDTDQDLRDDYYQHLWKTLLDYLEDSVEDGEFTFREVGIYKSYILNNYSKKKLIEETGISRTVIMDAIRKIEAHLKKVDWFLKPSE